MWHDGINKVALEILDYGIEFPLTERYDYRIATFAEDGTQDFIPGVCEHKGRMRKKVREMAAFIALANNKPCKVVKDVIATESHNDSEKNDTLKHRKTRHKAVSTQKRHQRKKDNGVIR